MFSMLLVNTSKNIKVYIHLRYIYILYLASAADECIFYNKTVEINHHLVRIGNDDQSSMINRQKDTQIIGFITLRTL